jgi:hypothetical protein
MMRMGVWTENLSIPAVLNECMLQSYSGTLRVFPNTIRLGPARFQNLRAAGAFLVSASYDGQTISPVEIFSEKGETVRLLQPWGELGAKVICVSDSQPVAARTKRHVVELPTREISQYRVEPAF